MEIAKKLWIQNSWADTIFYSFGWIVILTLLLIFQNNYAWIILIVLLFNYVHRHYTFALVYGENEEFSRRRLIYIALPALARSDLCSGLFLYLELTKKLTKAMYSSACEKAKTI